MLVQHNARGGCESHTRYYTLPVTVSLSPPAPIERMDIKSTAVRTASNCRLIPTLLLLLLPVVIVRDTSVVIVRDTYVLR